jgi:hypothetical protein
MKKYINLISSTLKYARARALGLKFALGEGKVQGLVKGTFVIVAHDSLFLSFLFAQAQLKCHSSSPMRQSFDRRSLVSEFRMDSGWL